MSWRNEARALVAARIWAADAPEHIRDRALALLYQNQVGQSEGMPQNILNMAVVEALASLVPEAARQPLETLAVASEIISLARTQRTRHFPPPFIEAHERFDQLLLSLRDQIPRAAMPALRARAERAYWISQDAVVRDKRTAQISLISPAGEAGWYARFEHDRSGVYLRAGHVSPNALRLEVSWDHAADGSEVYSVLVSCTIRQRHRCHLPAASEIVVRDGRVTFSPWRVGVECWEALLPQQGSTVRLGDLIIESHHGLPEFVERAAPRVQPLFLARLEPHLEAKLQWAGAYYVDAPADGMVGHPDHYVVRVPGPVWVIRLAAGETQYRPREERGD